MSRRNRRKQGAVGPATATAATTVQASGIKFGGRVDAVDAMRGFALCAMIVYHFCFDLNWFGFIRADFNRDPLWLGARACIVSMFLLLVGISLVLADRAGVGAARFWRRIATVAGCALLVTAASYFMFPATFISFGILHFIVVASILARP